MNEEEIRQYIIAKRNPVSNCADLSKYFIGRHKVLPVYLTPQFEREFNSKMYQLEQLKDNWNKLKQYLLSGVSSDNYIITENSMLSKMQELEKGDK